ncbi:aminotransferase class I/II-fold pyridoxal phosphate-dependent enzyme [Paenibacillus alkaliterrae]|uniref:aminotransferase class I/II-fold pyridoxal phosphate-dependent enzyme n=1 Tax=Paenibacillus alkaliterrae TaxID=320909 RepID=UPI001F36147A|nr:aminotransferase class I/II-fold pyridoxal phosphate-dependent enzyme [Paenibacillus alkaliterrae]MCF2941510.1 aminotransferase class I/II-fold pyridoxal phosphate-dependent enzyme [Paenibacillus alkaliterrae]
MEPFFSPILNALIKHAQNRPAGFHVPGHRYGQALQQDFQLKEPAAHPAVWFTSIMQLDVTELSSTDDLHHPEASILEAQQLAARTFGAEETFFLVGGSTSANIALLLTLCEPGEKIIVQRNVHKSVINGLKLSGAVAVFLSPQVGQRSGLATIPTVEQVGDALRLYPDAKAVLLSSPNYYGMGVRLKPYAELVHKSGIPLVVDEAHGAHYGFHPDLPQSSLADGVDAVVQSAHKTLPTLTMGAMLHVQGNRIDREILRQSLAMIQSSSPSFPILASIDISRAMIDSLGNRMFEQSIAAAASFRDWLRQQSTAIEEIEYDIMAMETDESTTHYTDPLRVVIYDSSSRLSGFELQRRLEQYGCFAEMADPRYVVLVFGIQASLEDNEKLQHAIEVINEECQSSAKASHKEDNAYAQMYISERTATVTAGISDPVSFSRERFNNQHVERINLTEAQLRISAEMVTPYPPGIAILNPGEIITSMNIEQIRLLSEAGAKFQGAADPTMQTIAVYHKKDENNV